MGDLVPAVMRRIEEADHRLELVVIKEVCKRPLPNAEASEDLIQDLPAAEEPNCLQDDGVGIVVGEVLNKIEGRVQPGQQVLADLFQQASLFNLVLLGAPRNRRRDSPKVGTACTRLRVDESAGNARPGLVKADDEAGFGVGGAIGILGATGTAFGGAMIWLGRGGITGAGGAAGKGCGFIATCATILGPTG